MRFGWRMRTSPACVTRLLRSAYIAERHFEYSVTCSYIRRSLKLTTLTENGMIMRTLQYDLLIK